MPGKEEPPSQFDPAALSEVLHTASHPTTDLAFGTGQRYDLASGHLNLEVFPERPLTRLTTPTTRVELFGTPPPRVVHGQVVIGQGTGHADTTVTVSPDGTVVFSYVHRPAPSATSDVAPAESDAASEASEEPGAAPERPHKSPDAVSASDAPLVAGTQPEASLRPPASRGRSSAVTSSPPDTAPAAEPEAAVTSGRHTADTPTTEQPPRLQLTGRLGRDPSFRTSPRGTLTGRFPLAMHHDDGTTSWHTILAFGDRAKQLQHRFDAGELTKGQEVNLVGYPHTRTQPTRDGGSKTVTEIYAVAVTRR